MMKSKKSIISLILVMALLVTANPVITKSASKRAISEKKLVLWKGEVAKLTILNKKKGDKITWKSSKKAIVKVSKKGKVTAKKAGTAKVIAVVKKNGKKVKKFTCKITVKKIPTEDYISVAVPTTPCAIADLQMEECSFEITDIQVNSKKKDAADKDDKPFSVSVTLTGKLNCRLSEGTDVQTSQATSGSSVDVSKLHTPMILQYQLLDLKKDVVEAGKAYFFQYEIGKSVEFTCTLELDSYGGEYTLKFPTRI